MTKQKHFYLIRGLIREKGHWGAFSEFLLAHFPEALITYLDIPGAGEYYQETSPFLISGMVEEMRLDYLKNKKDREDSHFIAISLGGMIALEWIRRYPKDFFQGTLINSSIGGISPVYHRLRPTALTSLFKVPCLKGRDKESCILGLVSNDRSHFNSTLDAWEAITKDRPVSMLNSLRQLLAAGFFQLENFTPPIPILVLAATHDRMVNVECSRSVALKWNLPLKEHPTAGHDLTVDDPEWVAGLIREFIEP